MVDQSSTDFRGEIPGELLGDGVDLLLGDLGLVRLRLVGLCVRRQLGLEERGRGRIDRLQRVSRKGVRIMERGQSKKETGRRTFAKRRTSSV